MKPIVPPDAEVLLSKNRIVIEVDTDSILSAIREVVLTEAVTALQEFMDAETARTEWDGSPGLLGNYIGGIRSSAALVQGLINQK